MPINKINKKMLNLNDAGELPGFNMSFFWQKMGKYYQRYIHLVMNHILKFNESDKLSVT